MLHSLGSARKTLTRTLLSWLASTRLCESYRGAQEHVKNDDASLPILATGIAGCAFFDASRYTSNSLSFLAFLIANACESLLK